MCVSQKRKCPGLYCGKNLRNPKLEPCGAFLCNESEVEEGAVLYDMFCSERCRLSREYVGPRLWVYITLTAARKKADAKTEEEKKADDKEEEPNTKRRKVA